MSAAWLASHSCPKAGVFLELPRCGCVWELLPPQWTAGACQCLAVSKANAAGGELGENLPHLLPLGGWAFTTWLPAVQVAGHPRGVRVCTG